MTHAPVAKQHTDRATPPDDLSDMPRDPRWRDVHGSMFITLKPGGCGVSVPAGLDQLRNCQLLDWWHVYYCAERAVRELQRRLAEQARAARPSRRPRPAPPVQQIDAALGGPSQLQMF